MTAKLSDAGLSVDGIEGRLLILVVQHKLKVLPTRLSVLRSTQEKRGKHEGNHAHNQTAQEEEPAGHMSLS